DGNFKCALYLKEPDNTLTVKCMMGFIASEKENLSSFFGCIDVLQHSMRSDTIIKIPSMSLPEEAAKLILTKAKLASGALIPIHSQHNCLGVLFIGSESTDINDKEPIFFAQALGTQI